MAGIKTGVRVGLGRMKAVKEQFNYLFRRVACMTSESEIENYLEAVENKDIKSFTFSGVKQGTKQAICELIIEVDWEVHAVLTEKEPYIYTDHAWGEDRYSNASPDVKYVAGLFEKRCRQENLKIDWCFQYSNFIDRAALNKKLGAHTTTPEERIIPPINKGAYATLNDTDIREITYKYTL